MMMRKAILFLLALCVALGALPALAQAEGTLRVLQCGDYADQYRAVNPGLAIKTIAASYDDNNTSNLPALLSAGDWDVACVWTDDISLSALDEAGMLLDLSGESALADRVNGMYEAVQKGVSPTGKLIGVPISLWGQVMQLGFLRGEGSTLQQLGMTEADAPRTFAQLRALAEKYAALPKETRRGTAFSWEARGGRANAKRYFLSYLIDLYAAQYTEPTGTVDFDTPVFRTALSDLDALCAAIQNAGESRGENGSFYTLVADCSSSLMPASYSAKFYLSTSDERNDLPARLGVLVINAATPRKAEALAFVDWLSAQETANAPLLNKAVDYDALVRADYEETYAAQIEEHEKQSVLDNVKSRYESGAWDIGYTAADIALYAEKVAPRLTFPQAKPIDNQTPAMAYAHGTLDAEGLIAALNDSAKK